MCLFGSTVKRISGVKDFPAAEAAQQMVWLVALPGFTKEAGYGVKEEAERRVVG